MSQKIELDSFYIIGITVVTNNKDNKSVIDLGLLWEKFYYENILSKIPNKLSNNIYSIYTNYQSDYTGDYTSIIGCKVSSLEHIPKGLEGFSFASGKYIKFSVSGKIPDSTLRLWNEIWNKTLPLDRKYAVDFEVYGEKSQNPEEAEIDVYISIK